MPIDQEHLAVAASYIKERLQLMNKTYAELGAPVGLGAHDLTRMSNGIIQEPSFRVVCKMAQILNCTLDEMAALYGLGAPTGTSHDRRIAHLAHVATTLAPDKREMLLKIIESITNSIDQDHEPSPEATSAQ